MDERQLAILRELGEQGSVQAVATTIGVTPSAVSQQLKLLQREVAVPLTRKSGRVLQLTEEGRRLASAAADVQTAFSRAREVARGLGAVAAGRVTVCAFHSAALAVFPALSGRFARGHAIEVALSDEDVSQDEFPALAAHYDIVIAHRLQHTGGWPANVSVTPLLHEQLDVAMAAAHPLARLAGVRVADVADQPWITTHAGFPVGATLDAVAAAAGRPLDVRHRVNEFTVVAEMVRAGAGVAFLPRFTQPRPQGVVLRPLVDLPVARDVDALVRPENTVRPAVAGVLAALVELATTLARTTTTTAAYEGGPGS